MTSMNSAIFRWFPFLATAMVLPYPEPGAAERLALNLASPNGIIMNPQAAYSFLGNDALGRALGLERDGPLQVGAF